jgi:hypothetical protein
MRERVMSNTTEAFMTRLMYCALIVLCTALCGISLSAQDSKTLAPLPANNFYSPEPGVAKGLSTTRRQSLHPATWRNTFIGYDPRQKQLVEFDANTFEAGVYASETGSSS